MKGMVMTGSESNCSRVAEHEYALMAQVDLRICSKCSSGKSDINVGYLATLTTMSHRHISCAIRRWSTPNEQIEGISYLSSSLHIALLAIDMLTAPDPCLTNTS